MSEKEYNPAETQVGQDPKHKQLMAWGVDDEAGYHKIQYHHGSMGFGTSAHNFTMHDSADQFVGTMGLDEDGRIQHIEVNPDVRRQGLATKLYKFGHEVHKDIPSIPAPKHSSSRTESGDKWAESLGEKDVPKNTNFVPDERYRAQRWPSVRNASVGKFQAHLNEFHAKMLANGMDNESIGKSLFHLQNAEIHLGRADAVGREHSSYFDHINRAHQEVEELGYIHEDNYGDMEEHEKLMDHISKLYPDD